MRKLLFTICAILVFSTVFAQKVTIYHAYADEFIFSYSMVKDNAGKQVPSALRFSGFFNAQYQLHFDFSKSLGVYTGLGIRNVGLITHPTDSIGKIKIKQRAYGINVPIAVKVGNMSKRSYLYAGAEAEYFFNYKEKVFIDNAKTKGNEWLSNKVTPFNPSVFLGYQHKGFFVVAKYYLLNFLARSSGLDISKNVDVPIETQSSQLFYIGVGINIKGGGAAKSNSIKAPKKASA